jgi:hypothetical protein
MLGVPPNSVTMVQPPDVVLFQISMCAGVNHYVCCCCRMLQADLCYGHYANGARACHVSRAPGLPNLQCVCTARQRCCTVLSVCTVTSGGCLHHNVTTGHICW